MCVMEREWRKKETNKERMSEKGENEERARKKEYDKKGVLR